MASMKSFKERYLQTTHGEVCRLAGDRFGYFGWPSIARLDDGRLAVVSSGMRTRHVCPWGRTVTSFSGDEGRTWTGPQVIQDSPIDDRDAGIVSLGSGKLLVTWFRSDTRRYVKSEAELEAMQPEERRQWQQVFDSWSAELASWNDEMVNELVGSWTMLSHDGGINWEAPVRCPVTAPHGPVLLRGGELLCLGKPFRSMDDLAARPIKAARSSDGGRTWEILGQVPLHPGTDAINYHEPHLVELPSGRLLGLIRIQNYDDKHLDEAGIPSFSIMQTESDDGGYTWSPPRPLGFHGSPPHVIRHSDGTLILSYGYRQAPFGQRVALSHDDGLTWEPDWILRDDGPDGDLGYPATVELPGGDLFTIYYQKYAAGENCSLLCSRWKLPTKGDWVTP